MKLQQLHEDAAVLEENMIKRAIAAAAVVAAGFGITALQQPDTAAQRSHTGIVQSEVGSQTGSDINQVVAHVSDKYRVNPKLVAQIVHAAKKHERPDFPRAQDILAVIGVESSFNPKAVSQLKRDPARGLMQVRPGVWGMDPNQLSTIDAQISKGAEILHAYYKKFGTKEAALHAYNVGETNHRKSLKKPEVGNPRYAPKVQAEYDQLKDFSM